MNDIMEINNFYDYKIKKSLQKISSIKVEILAELKKQQEYEEINNITKR